MTRTMRCAVAAGLCASLLGACAAREISPTYEFRAGYGPGIVTPAAIRRDLDDYAAPICGHGDYQILDRVFVGDGGPSYVHVVFGCT